MFNITEVAVDAGVPLGKPSEVIIDVAHQDSKFHISINSIVTNGEMLPWNKQGHINGFLAKLERIGPVYSSGQSYTRPSKCISPSITISCDRNAGSIELSVLMQALMVL